MLALWISLPLYLTGWLAISLRSGRCSKYKSPGYVYRDREPVAFWTFISIYATMDVLVIGWVTYLVLLAFRIVPCC